MQNSDREVHFQVSQFFEPAPELRPLTATVASGRRFGGIATHVRWSFAADAQLAIAPYFGAVSPTPWVCRAQPGVVSPSASARSGAPRTLGIRSRTPECMSVESIHSSLNAESHLCARAAAEMLPVYLIQRITRWLS